MRWTESIDVARPLHEVQQAIADEHELMQWSAWPAATGYTCVVEGDGTSPGSDIVFRDDDGTEQGRQRLAAVGPRGVEYRLRNRGPLGRDVTPEVDFRLDELTPTSTRVHLDFRNEVPLPPPFRQLAEWSLGRRVRALHVEDLRLLREHVEGRSRPDER